ncbi:MAG: UxaA family hydrolase [Desulfobacterales bacterium]|nr:UxaA family hydrolase [Desulfobacterales bacterium]
MEFLGFQRKDGSVGIRNYVGIISAMDNVNPLARKIVENVQGTVLISDLFGRKMMGTNHEMRVKALTGMGNNSNLGGVIVVSLHQPSAMSLAEPISASGKDVECIVFQELGSSLKCLEQGIRTAVKMVKKLSGVQRSAHPLSDLIIGVECGGSDFSSGISGNPALGNAADRLLDAGGTVVLSETGEIIGAEHILAKRSVSREVADKVFKAVKEIENLARAAGVSDIRESNPAADNIKGGITTLAEKALGAIKKAGNKPLKDVLGFCDAIPFRAPGFYFMSTPAPACESMTGLAAGGAQLIVFNTGLGNPSANPVTPTIKMTGNPYTVQISSDDIDIDVSDIISNGVSIEDAGERIFKEIQNVANGKMTFSEIFGISQSTISVVGASF